MSEGPKPDPRVAAIDARQRAATANFTRQCDTAARHHERMSRLLLAAYPDAIVVDDAFFIPVSATPPDPTAIRRDEVAVAIAGDLLRDALRDGDRELADRLYRRLADDYAQSSGKSTLNIEIAAALARAAANPPESDEDPTP